MSAFLNPLFVVLNLFDYGGFSTEKIFLSSKLFNLTNTKLINVYTGAVEELFGQILRVSWKFQKKWNIFFRSV